MHLENVILLILLQFHNISFSFHEIGNFLLFSHMKASGCLLWELQRFHEHS